MPFLDAKYIEDVMEIIEGLVEQTRDAVQVPGTPYGMKRGTPEDEAAAFEQKCAENPNFALCLPYVKGGPELIARYEKTRGLR